VQPSLALLALLVVTGGSNLWLVEHFPERKLFGDESVYARNARVDADKGLSSLLPGRLRFTHRPSLHGHVLSQIGPDPSSLSVAEYRAELFASARHFNIVLTLLGTIALYVVGVQLGMGAWTALLPPLLLACLPRVTFHIHGLWSETLHLFLELVFFACVCASLANGKKRWLAVGGVALGLAVLVRATASACPPIRGATSSMAYADR
jgi:hypothetical protein